MRALAIAAMVCAFASADTFSYRQKAQDAVNRLDVQRSLPEDSNTADPPKSHATGISGGRPESDSEAPPLGIVWDKLKWVALAAVVLAMGGFVASQIAESRRFAVPVSASVPSARAAQKAPLPAEQLLAEADACAAQGRYRDAMHFVLLAGIAHVTRRFRDGAPDSATSWELLRAAELKPLERTALRDLMTRTDRAWFGEYASGLEDYRGARQCLQIFLAGGETA